MFLSEIIVQSCRKILTAQNSDGSFEPGWNGPYNDPDTPVRNTAHWLITLLKAYELTDASDFKHAAVKAADYLLTPNACPMNAAFFCRKNPQKDFSNGLIGQAWVIEALVIAADALKTAAYFDKAMEVFEKHYFNEALGLWRILNVDGSYAAVDMTFNHQLWFAMAGAMLASHRQSKSITAKLIRFLDKTNDSNFAVAKTGRIIHGIRKPLRFKRIGNFALKLSRPDKLIQEIKGMRHKESGYHGFNLYGFAVLHQHIPDHKFWQSMKFRQALSFMDRSDFSDSLSNNEFAYPYNPAGFEIAFAMEKFSDIIDKPKRPPEWWINKQMDCCYNSHSKLMNKNTMDKLTLAARLYEASRLSNFEVRLNK